jgi:hypothetical protein
MLRRFPKVWLNYGVLLLALVGGSSSGNAQGPSSNLKEADAYYRAGAATLSRNDVKTALADFDNVVRLAPAAEQGHSALGAVLVRLGRPSEGIHELEMALASQPSDASARQSNARRTRTARSMRSSLTIGKTRTKDVPVLKQTRVVYDHLSKIERSHESINICRHHP